MYLSSVKSGSGNSLKYNFRQPVTALMSASFKTFNPARKSEKGVNINHKSFLHLKAG